MKKLLISDSNNITPLSFELRDILQLLEDGEKFSWLLEKMYINYLIPDVTHTEPSKSDSDLLELIIDSEKYEIKWKELIRIANFHIQIINGKITGNCGEELITITAFDSSYWIIETNLDSLINKIKGRFESVRDISNESINYGN